MVGTAPGAGAALGGGVAVGVAGGVFSGAVRGRDGGSVRAGPVKATTGGSVCTGAGAAGGADLVPAVVAGWEMRGSAGDRGAEAAGAVARTEAACPCA